MGYEPVTLEGRNEWLDFFRHTGEVYKQQGETGYGGYEGTEGTVLISEFNYQIEQYHGPGEQYQGFVEIGERCAMKKLGEEGGFIDNLY